jgi:hypothetical protein
MKRPSFAALARAEQQLLEQRLVATRAVLAHAGEKGRSLEASVQSLLRSFLPAEYGLTTGFVACRPPDEREVLLSSQLDVIIYDAVRGAPIARFDTCDVLPLEAVYAYVEVKTSLRDNIREAVEQSARLRRWTSRWFYRPVPQDPVLALEEEVPFPAIRSYLFAFEWSNSSAAPPEVASVASAIEGHAREVDHPAFLSAVFVNGLPLLRSVPGGNHAVECGLGPGLAELKWRLLMDLARFPRYPAEWCPSLRRYSPASLGL